MGQRAESEGAGVGVSNLSSLESLQHALGWQRAASIPSRWPLCSDLEVTAVLVAVGCLSCENLATGAVSGRPCVRCCAAVSHAARQHGILLYRLGAARVCGKNGVALSPVLCGQARCCSTEQTVFCDGVISSGLIILASLMQNSEKSTVGTKPFLISCLAFNSSYRWNHEISRVLL